MKCRIHDYPTRILVTSESESGADYLVNVASPTVIGEDGNPRPNGTCTCMNFMCQLNKLLLAPDNHTTYRCKHIRAAREFLLDYVIPEMDKRDPNIKEEFQP